MEISIFIFMKIYPIYGVYHIYFIYNQSNTYSQFKHSRCLIENIFLSPFCSQFSLVRGTTLKSSIFKSSSFLYKFTSMFINSMISLPFFIFQLKASFHISRKDDFFFFLHSLHPYLLPLPSSFHFSYMSLYVFISPVSVHSVLSVGIIMTMQYFSQQSHAACYDIT